MAGSLPAARCAPDKVERVLFNRGSSAVDLTGWSLQYATASGSSWQATALAGSVQPGKGKDLISRVFFWDDNPATTGDPQACQYNQPGDFPMEPIENGNIQVKNG